MTWQLEPVHLRNKPDSDSKSIFCKENVFSLLITQFSAEPSLVHSGLRNKLGTENASESVFVCLLFPPPPTLQSCGGLRPTAPRPDTHSLKPLSVEFVQYRPH